MKSKLLDIIYNILVALQDAIDKLIEIVALADAPKDDNDEQARSS